MKVRTAEELTERLAEDLKQRKREIAAMKSMISMARPHEKDCLLRAGMVLLYAHFEGFVKTAGTAYLTLVKHKGLSYNELTPNFVAAALKTKLENLGEVKKATVVTSVIRQLQDGANDAAMIEWSGAIDCRDNLDSDVLDEITCLLGLAFGPYETKGHFINESLLKKRNGIAHGELVRVDEDTFGRAHDGVVALLEQFRNDIENAAVTESFRR